MGKLITFDLGFGRIQVKRECPVPPKTIDVDGEEIGLKSNIIRIHDYKPIAIC